MIFFAILAQYLHGGPALGSDKQAMKEQKAAAKAAAKQQKDAAKQQKDAAKAAAKQQKAAAKAGPA